MNFKIRKNVLMNDLFYLCISHMLHSVCFVYVFPQVWPPAATLLFFLSSQTQNVHSIDSTPHSLSLQLHRLMKQQIVVAQRDGFPRNPPNCWGYFEILNDKHKGEQTHAKVKCCF